MIRHQVNASKVLAASAKLPTVVRKHFGDALDHISLKFLKRFRQNTRVKFRPRGLFTRFKRIFAIPTNSRSMSVEIFTQSKIAKLHEYGGEMRGKGGLRLAVPLSSRRAQVTTASGKVKARFGGTPYNRDVRPVKNIRPINIKGKTFLARVQRGSREVLPLFVLKDGVRVPARLGFYDTWRNMQGEAQKIVDKAVAKAAKEAWV